MSHKEENIQDTIEGYLKAKNLYERSSFKEATSILEELLEANFSPAYYLMSIFYARGHHVKRNRDMAVILAEKGALLGHLGCVVLLYRYNNTMIGFRNFVRYFFGIFLKLLHFILVLVAARGITNKIRVMI